MLLNRFACLLSFSVFAAVVAATASCVTVNVPVTFPESSVQQVTDSYVRELYRAKEKGRGPVTTTQVSPTPSPSVKPQARLRLEIFSAADAAEEAPQFRVASPKTSEIQSREASRIEELLPLEHEGTVGEANDGYLVIRGTGMKALLKKKISKVVDEENADRKALYKEILKINGPSVKLQSVQTSFARSFQLAAPSGTWVQDPDGNWDQKQ